MFSEKYGYKPEQTIQHEYVSPKLRSRIWNLFYLTEIKKTPFFDSMTYFDSKPSLTERIADKLGLLIEQPTKEKTITNELMTSLRRDFAWNEVYDFIEYHVALTEKNERKSLKKQYNELLEEEKSAYRFVADEIAPITNDEEIDALERASSTPVDSVNQHISKALSFYSDLENPDYENSIKESISAVEAMCCVIVGKNATLGKALKKLKESGVYVHDSLEKSFLTLYGFTSDESGIRHGWAELATVSSEDAKFMLIVCSAFVNYLIEKWTKSEIESGTPE